MSECNEWMSQLSVFRLHCDMETILPTPGKLSNSDPGRGTAHRTPQTNPGLCLTESAPPHRWRGNRAYQPFPCCPGLAISKRKSAQKSGIVLSSCFNCFLYWIDAPDDFRSNTRLCNRQHEVGSRNPLLLR